jgi:hypothetical protein
MKELPLEKPSEPLVTAGGEFEHVGEVARADVGEELLGERADGEGQVLDRGVDARRRHGIAGAVAFVAGGGDGELAEHDRLVGFGRVGGRGLGVERGAGEEPADGEREGIAGGFHGFGLGFGFRIGDGSDLPLGRLAADDERAGRGIAHGAEPGAREHAVEGLARGVVAGDGVGPFALHLVHHENDLLAGGAGELVERRGGVAGGEVVAPLLLDRRRARRRGGRQRAAKRGGDEPGRRGEAMHRGKKPNCPCNAAPRQMG